MIKLRDYQQETVEAIRGAYRQGKRAPLVVLSTGGGKTTIFCYVAQSAAAKSGIVFIVAHREELIKQIADTLARSGQPHRVVSNDSVIRQCKVEQFKKYGQSYVDHSSSVYVASVQTLINRFDQVPDPTLIIIDESHHVVDDNQWGKIVNQFPMARLLMVTATPIRSDGKGLGKGHGGFADELIQGKSMKWLVEQGYLSPYRYFAPPTEIDLTDVNTTAKGDYNTKKLSDAVDKPTITGDAVKHYLALAKGKRAVVFCASVSHAMHVSQQFNDAGVSSEFIEGKTDDRAAMINRFGTGETLVLTSCDLISEGFDLPAIEVAILLRPTKSTSLFMQQVGRALRIFEGKTEAIILDHVQAWKSHGFPDDHREWSLEGVKKRKRTKADDDEPNVDIKHCPSCYAIHAPAPVCPNCGHEYPITARKLEQVEGELVELNPQEIERKKARIEQGKAQSVEALIALGKPRKQAEMIVKAREEKQALITDIMEGLNSVYRTKRKTSMQAFGVTSLDVRAMKPKALKELKQRIEIELNGN